jgi:hypothetical protein
MTFATAEACPARFWIHRAAGYYRAAFALSAALCVRRLWRDLPLMACNA